MSVVVRFFALALIAMLLFSGCAGNEAKKELSTSSTIASTTTAIPSTTTTSKKVTTTTTSTTSTTSMTTSTLADPYRPNPQAVLLSNLSNTGFAASYENYSFSIGHLVLGPDNSIVGALLHVARPDGTYVDLSVIKDSSDSALDKKLIIRFAPAYAKDVSGIQTAGIYIWEENTSSGAVPNESATTSTGWIKIQSALNITYMEDGSFEAVFINDAGYDVKINDVLLNETDLDLKCKNILVNGRQASMAYPVAIKNNETFNISADCPSKDYDTGYFLDISISYKAVLDNEVVDHRETGRMTGGVKAYNEHYTP